MKLCKSLMCILCSAALIFTSSINSAYADKNKWTRLVENCGDVLTQVQEMPDQSIPEDLMQRCSAIAVFPSTISAGIGIGGKYGQGIIMVRNERSGKWSSPAIFTLAGGSIGWQIGGQATDIVLLFMGREGINGILEGKFKLGVDAAVSAGPVGRNAEASTDVKFSGILSYSRSRGLFAGVKLEGVVITQHWEGDKELYGKSLSAEEILLENKAKMPGCADTLLGILKKYPYKRG